MREISEYLYQHSLVKCENITPWTYYFDFLDIEAAKDDANEIISPPIYEIRLFPDKTSRVKCLKHSTIYTSRTQLTDGRKYCCKIITK